jgi:hypothetical protein
MSTETGLSLEENLDTLRGCEYLQALRLIGGDRREHMTSTILAKGSVIFGVSIAASRNRALVFQSIPAGI